jgi:hypothetical protein
MVAYINDCRAPGNIFLTEGFDTNEGEGKKKQAPDLVEKCHGRLPSPDPDAQTKEWEQEEKTEKPPESGPKNKCPPDQIG